MRVERTFTVPASRMTVWESLLDPDVLGMCIPGASAVRKHDDRHYEVDVDLKLSFMRLTFLVEGWIRDVTAGECLTADLVGQPRGFAGAFQAETTVRLAPAEGGGTCVHVVADASVAGRLSSLGEPLLRGTAESLADQFAANLAARLAARSDVGGSG